MKNKLAILFILLSSFALYLLTVRGTFGNFLTPDEYNNQTNIGQAFESSHERSPYALYLAITQFHTTSLNQDEANFGSPDVGYYGGKFFSFFPLGIPLLIIPFHALGNHYNLGQIFSYMGIALFSALSLVFIFKILREIFGLPIWISLFGALVYGFATTSWSYSNTIYQHPVTVFLLTSMFYCIWKYKQNKKFGWVFAGYVWIAYAFSFLVDYPNAFILLPLMFYFLIVSIKITRESNSYKISLRMTILVTFVAFLAVSAWHLRYNYKNFGGYVKFSNTLPRYTANNLNQLQNESAADIAAKTGNPAGVFRESSLVNGLRELTVAPDKGLFFYSPILLLSLLGIYALRKKITLELGVLISIAAVDLFMYASFGDPWGGWAFGPRYAIPAMAALSMLLAVGMAKTAEKLWARILLFLMFAYSSAIALLGALTTNLIPPKVEAIYFNLKYSVPASINFLKNGTTGNFIFKNYVSGHLTLQEYYFVIYIPLIVTAAVILFVLPHFTKPHEPLPNN